MPSQTSQDKGLRTGSRAEAEQAIVPKLLSVRGAVKYSGLSRSQIYRVMWRLQPKKRGSTTLISRVALDVYLEGLPDMKVSVPPDYSRN